MQNFARVGAYSLKFFLFCIPCTCNVLCLTTKLVHIHMCTFRKSWPQIIKGFMSFFHYIYYLCKNISLHFDLILLLSLSDWF